MICHRPALRLRREPAFARTVSVGAPHVPPTLLLSPHFKTDAPSTHFIILVCGRAKSAARPVIHPNLYQEHMPSVVYARHPASVLVSDAGMVLKRALVEPTNRGLMLNEGKADVLPDEAVGTGEGRHTTERKIADPYARQIAARRQCTLGSRRAAHERCDNPCAQEPDPTEPHDSSSRSARSMSNALMAPVFSVAPSCRPSALARAVLDPIFEPLSRASGDATEENHKNPSIVPSENLPSIVGGL